MKKRKAVVLLSGGMDSAVALWWAKKKGWSCFALSFDYGQRHKKEINQARLLARTAQVPFRLVRFSLPWGGSSLTDSRKALPKNRPTRKMRDRIPSTYVPARNTIFLSFALSWADQMKSEAIVIGANAIDYSGYPDCRPRYMKAFERVSKEGTRQGVEMKSKISILTPLLNLTKVDIVKLGQSLNVPLHLTWSCYAGKSRPCDRCDSCRLREKGFQEAGI
ncbi:7-cyano-7-deazaguanine synthase QueC [bacterium F11]|nr:7-cyano-7-deazaguanine synthase QueC [bacterium F11]